MKVLSLTNTQPVSTPLKIDTTKPIIHINRKVALPTMEGLNFERVNQIVSLEAQGNYTCLHLLDGRQILVCKTLRDMEDHLCFPDDTGDFSIGSGIEYDFGSKNRR